MTPDVLIVGAGLAGLCCGRELAARGMSFRIFEAGEHVGGRVRTDLIDGFRLDRGMQNYLSSYPEGKRVLDYERLRLRPFRRALLVRHRGKFHRLADPREDFLTAAFSAFAPVGTLGDKLAAAKLTKLSAVDPAAVPDESTAEFLKSTGVGEQMVQRVFRPFFGSVSLDSTLGTSARFFRFVYHLFGEGAATLPAGGMQEIPDQIKNALPHGSVRLNSRVTKIDGTTLTLATGERITGRAVVIATAGPDAVPLGEGAVPAVGSNGSTTVYYAADEPPVEEPILMLDGDGAGPVQACVVTSEVSRDYAPANKHLIAAAMAGIPDDDDDTFDSRVRAQLSGWFGAYRVGLWKTLKVYRIRHALPSQPVGVLEPWERPVKLRDGLYVCGDHRDNASINGAMTSGRRAAEAVAAELQK